MEPDSYYININVKKLGELYQIKNQPDRKLEFLTCSNSICTKEAVYYTDQPIKGMKRIGDFKPIGTSTYIF